VIFALAGPDTDSAVRNKVVDAGTLRHALRNGLILIGSAPGSASKAELDLADLPQLIAGKRLAIANPRRDPAGARAVDLLRKAGVTVDDGNKAIAVAESTAGVASMLAIGKAQLGIVYASDAAAGGFLLVRPLPTSDQPPIEYVVAQARDPMLDTKPFLAFLKSPEAQATFKAAGLLPIDE
jgi:molybdenum ABC transporter molybdate-binding protein